MDRRRLALCAGTLAGLILGPTVGYVTVHQRQPGAAERAPKPFLAAPSDVRALPGSDPACDVVATGLIEPAVPPTIKKKAAPSDAEAPSAAPNQLDEPPAAPVAPDRSEPAPIARYRLSESPEQAPAAKLILTPHKRRGVAPNKPATIDAAPLAQPAPVVKAPVAQPEPVAKTPAAEPSVAAPPVAEESPAPARVAAKQPEPATVPADDKEASPAPEKSASEFNIVGPARSKVAEPAKPKTPFVTGAIEPALPPTVPPKMPLTVEPVAQPQTAKTDSPAPPEGKPAKPSPIEIGKLVESHDPPAPADASISPGEEPAQSPSSRVAKRDEPAAESPTELAADQPTPAPTEAAAEDVADAPASEPEARQAEPIAKPEPSLVAEAPKTESRLVEQKLAPAPVDVAPSPAVQPAPEKLADESPAAGTPRQPSGERRPSENEAKLANEPAPHAPAMMPLAKDEGARLPGGSQAELWSKQAKRSPELVAAIKRADGLVMHGYNLASRGASYAARSEFIAAIKTIAQAYDMEDSSRRHSKAAAAGLTALQEAGDFMRLAQSLDEIAIDRIVVPHSTPILKEADNADLSPIAAAQCYYSYAQEQLGAAVGQEVVGSMALYAMGKVAVMSGKSTAQAAESTAQGMALYRAALIADGKNYRAANELGVLLAQNGQYELARDLLLRSVAVSPQVTTWKNLATVHARNGERNLAERAHQQALAMQKQGRSESPTPAVQWVDAATFASTNAASDNMPPAAPVAAAQPTNNKPAATAAGAKPPVNVAKKSIADWLKVSPRRQ